MAQKQRALALLCGILSICLPKAAPATTSVPAPVSDKPQVDAYILATNVNSNQPCTTPTSADSQAVFQMIKTRLAGYTVIQGTKAGPDYLGQYPQGSGQYVLIATVCSTASVYAITINGYYLGLRDDDQASGSLTGSFDALEAADWSTVFGTAPMYPFAAFLPISNDPNSIVNPRLLRNLPLTLIATPAPAPIAPPPPGQPAPPLPPPTRLKQCQASAYQMLVIGRAVITSTNNDVSRAIVAGSALQFKQPVVGPWYQTAGAVLGLLYNPSSADTSVDVFICPNQAIDVYDDSTSHVIRHYDANKLYQVGGENAHIAGHNTTKAIGVDPFANQRALDLATTDLADQLDCIIYRELAELKIPDYKKKQGAIYGYGTNADLGASDWCTNYYNKLKEAEGQSLVIRPATGESAP